MVYGISMIKKMQKKKINLALQGGGSHGAFTWGVLDRLLEEDSVEIDAISATSAGAMNATILAEGYRENGREGARDKLKKFWQAVSQAGEKYSPLQKIPFEKFFQTRVSDIYLYTFFDTLTRIFSPYVLNPDNLHPLKKILSNLIDFQALQASEPIKLFICATNVKSGKPKIFQKAQLTPEILLASACIPNLFQAVEIDQEYYWDGGYIGNPAIYPLIYETTTTDIVVVHVNPINRPTVPKTSIEISNRINEISFNAALIREFRVMAFVNKLITEKWIKKQHAHKIKKIHLHAIRNDKMMSDFSIVTKLEWEWNFFLHLYALGRQTTDSWLVENSQFLSKKSTADLTEFDN